MPIRVNRDCVQVHLPLSDQDGPARLTADQIAAVSAIPNVFVEHKKDPDAADTIIPQFAALTVQCPKGLGAIEGKLLSILNAPAAELEPQGCVGDSRLQQPGRIGVK